MSELLITPASPEDDFDPDGRALCPDDACIGLLDSDGRCKECGRQGTAATGAERVRSDSALRDAEDDAAQVDAAASSPAPADAGAAEEDGEAFSDRQLCADPSCIGVLDVKGRCKECGRAAAD